jgi:hypothetical protein
MGHARRCVVAGSGGEWSPAQFDDAAVGAVRPFNLACLLCLTERTWHVGQPTGPVMARCQGTQSDVVLEWFSLVIQLSDQTESDYAHVQPNGCTLG